MTVYVDDARIAARVGRISGRWSHLLADTDAELHALAARLGLRRAWAQRPGAVHSHYDVTDAVRRRAIALGAVPIDRRQLIALITQRRQGRASGTGRAGASRAGPG